MDLLRNLPLGLYLEQPITWLHRLDPRVKLAWLMSFLFAPILANPESRIALSLLLISITFGARIPLRVWRQQMGWLLLLCFFVFILGAISPDGFTVKYNPRLPADEIAFELPQPKDPQKNPQSPNINFPEKYSYIVFKQGPIKISRRSIDLGIRISTLLFTLIYSTNLYLLTTAPEEITTGIESLMRPLRKLNWPVTEIVLTLTLSLRFIPLVLEEVQNLVRSVWTRAIDWKKLGLRRATRLWMTVAERLLKNLLLRAEQIASAMKVRGFTSPDRHRVQWSELRLKKGDWFAILSLALFWVARLIWGNGL